MRYQVILLSIICAVALGLRVHHNEDQPNWYVNLNAENWIYGSSQKEYEQDRFVSVIKHSQSRQCPIRRPFTVDGTQCIQCPVEFPIFNLETRQCVRCPRKNEIVDHKCA